MIDLRSDTVTRPTGAMRHAMATAEVGDDAYGEDPTVNRLEERAASLMGKERALFVPSGTMGNQIAIAVHAARGTEVICEARAHVVEHELASMAVISGCMPRPVSAPDGILTAALIDRHLRPDLPGHPRAGLILIENTHNLAGGVVTPVDELLEVSRLAGLKKIPVHMDGARIFNAATALQVPAGKLAAAADSVTFCLSKGLGAPVGSLLTGPKDFIEEARRWRRRLGGGMRQAGVLAAAGIVALETMRDRLGEDHENARRLAEGIALTGELTPIVPAMMTNIVYVAVGGKRWRNVELQSRLKAGGVLCNTSGDDRLRFVTHHQVSTEQIHRACDAVRRAIR